MKKYLIRGFSALVIILMAQIVFAQSAITFQMSLVDELKEGSFNPATDRVEVRGSLDGGLTLKNVYDNNTFHEDDSDNLPQQVSDFNAVQAGNYTEQNQLNHSGTNNGMTFNADQQSFNTGSTEQIPAADKTSPGLHSAEGMTVNRQSPAVKPQGMMSANAFNSNPDEGSRADKRNLTLNQEIGTAATNSASNRRIDRRGMSINQDQSTWANNNQQLGDDGRIKPNAPLDASFHQDPMGHSNSGSTSESTLTGIVMTEGTIVDSVYNVTIVFPAGLMGEELNFRFAKITGGEEHIEALVAPRIVTLSPGTREMNVCYFNIPSW